MHPTAVFVGLGEEPVSDEMAAELQEVMETSADGDGLTAAVISPQGIWNDGTGLALADNAKSYTRSRDFRARKRISPAVDHALSM